MKRLTVWFVIFAAASILPSQAQAPAGWPFDPADTFDAKIVVERVSTSSDPVGVPTPIPGILPCPGTQLMRSDFPDATWVAVTADETGLTHICNADTGELYDALPLTTVDWAELRPAPDGRNILLLVSLSEDFEHPILRVYGYGVDTGELVELGTVLDTGMGIQLERWLTPTVALIASLPTPRDFEYAIADVTREGSLETVIQSPNGSRSSERKSPARFETVRTYAEALRSYDPTEHVPCELGVFDLEEIRTYTFELGHDCGGLYSPDGFRYYYVTYPEDVTQPSTLSVADIRTQTQELLYSGEIEALESVSPDGRYAVVITDDNGVIDRETVPDTQFFTWDQAAYPMISVVDLTTSRVIADYPMVRAYYQRQYIDFEAVRHDTVYGYRPEVSVVWIDEKTFIVAKESPQAGELRHSLVTINANDVSEIDLIGSVNNVLPLRRYLIIKAIEGSAENYILYDAQSEATWPLFENRDAQEFEYRIWVEDSPRIDLSVDRSTDDSWARYRLLLPMMETRP